jgi:site-specific DNA recombinase
MALEVLESDRTERATRDQSMKRLQARHEQLQTHLDTMYVDKLEGRITQEFFDRQADTWRREQNAILRRIHDIQTAAPAPIKEAIDGLSLTSRACELFLQQSAAEQRRLLQTLVKSATWQDGALRTSLFEPFEILRHSNQGSCRNEMENSGSGRNFEIWLPSRIAKSAL